MSNFLSPVEVDKEVISSLSFKNNVDFRQDPGLIEKLRDATKLGNINKVKYKIDFYCDSGLKTVYTTIWATGNKYICLKGGVWIPISKIANLRFT